MIDYALGAKSHKSYIEIGNSCSQVELVLYIGKEKYLIRRQLFNFTAPVIVEDWNEEKKRFLFYNRFEIDTPKNPKSLSAFLIEKVGFANISITGQTFSFRDLFKYCYPEFIPHECIVVEFDPDQKNGLPLGLIDDAV